MSSETQIERLPEIPVGAVKIGDRVRRDMGDIEDLCESIEAQGLLQPIIVDQNLNLVCGERRLLAFKQLGLSVIPARVLDLPDLLRAEVDENRCRKDFTPSEAVEIGRKLEQVVATPVGRPTEEIKENFLNLEGGQTRDKVGQAVGLSGRTYEKAKAVVEAAEAEPARFGDLVQKMDTGEVSIHRAHAFIQNSRVIEATNERIATVSPPAGTYRCVVIDPPWPVTKIARDCRPNQTKELDYPTMSLEEIEALPVPSVLDPAGCHVYLWVTQKYLPVGLDLFKAWGIKYQCCLTWVKPVGFTPFSWMYNTEHVLFGRVGSLDLQRMGRKLSFDAPVTEHSAKPNVFYDLVTECSPGPRLEMFSRKERDGFTGWGSE